MGQKETLSIPVLYPLSQVDPNLMSALNIAGLQEIYCYRLGMKNEFRGIYERSGLILEYAGGRLEEFSPFFSYGTAESARWLKAALTALEPKQPREQVAVNVTIPQVAPGQVSQLIQDSGGCQVAKVKVGYASAWGWEEKHLEQSKVSAAIEADLERLQAVRLALGPEGRIRIDVNGSWTLSQALTLIPLYNEAAGDLEYVEQPCRSVAELKICREETGVAVAADEILRRSPDPLAAVPKDSVDVLVLKMQPLGGYRNLEKISALASQRNMKIVLSSALESNIGIAKAVQGAASLNNPPLACGLATGQMFYGNITNEALKVENGALTTGLDFTLSELAKENFYRLSSEQQQETNNLAQAWGRRLRECWEYLSEANKNARIEAV